MSKESNLNHMKAILTSEQLEILRRLDACMLANAIETFGVRLRNEGFTDCSIHCSFRNYPRCWATPPRSRSVVPLPPTADNPYPDRTDWWDYVLSLPGPRVVVVEDVATKVGLGSLLGSVHVNILRALGCVGAVTNGAVRDLPAAEQMGFPLFSGSISVSHAYVHIVEFGTPVQIGGLKIQSRDLVHGDLHGVQTIPSEIAAKVPLAAAEIIAQNQELIALCQGGDFSLEKLRAVVARDRS